jgi:putrescine transport system permease protein
MRIPVLHKALRSLSGRHAVIGVPYLWLLVFFLFPFFIVLKISISEMEAVQF